MNKYLLFILLLFAVAGICSAGLWDPPVANPSFESQQISTWANYIDDWFDDSYWGTFIMNDTAYPTEYPESPYGNTYGGVESYGTMWQQIGTWDANTSYMVKLWLAQRAAQPFTGLEIALWAGGDSGSAADEMVPADIGAVKVDGITVNPFPEAGMASVDDYKVVLNTGSDMTSGDALWLVLYGTASGNQKLFDNISVGTPDIAHSPLPADGDPLVTLDQILRWSAPEGYTVSSYDLYFGNQGDPNVALNPKYNQTELTFDPDLAVETTYYWRVDALEPNDVGFIVHEGQTWTFTTAPPVPVISLDPVSKTVDAGATVQFTVAAVNTDTYTWYKSADAANDTPDDDDEAGTGATLEIPNVQVGDEGWYYCVASNGVDTDTSDVAQLMIKRLVGHWKFDGTLTNEVTGGGDGVIDDPNFAGGIDGSAIELFGDGRFVTISDSTDLYNFYPRGLTGIAWVKSSYTGNWSGIVGKHGRPDNDAGWVAYTNGNVGVATMRGVTPNDNYGSTTLTDGQWHMVATQYDPVEKRLKLFVDGVREAQSQVVSTSIPLTPTPVLIGTDRPDGSFPVIGIVDDVRVYNYALTPVEMAQIYTDFNPGTEVCLGELPYDFNDNCMVDIDDFVEIASSWMQCNLVPSCIN